MGESAFLADDRGDQGGRHGGAVAAGGRIAIGIAAPGLEQKFAPPGTPINVTAFRAKDGALRGSTRDIEFPDGRKMDMGGSSKDGQDKPDK